MLGIIEFERHRLVRVPGMAMVSAADHLVVFRPTQGRAAGVVNGDKTLAALDEFEQGFPSGLKYGIRFFTLIAWIEELVSQVDAGQNNRIKRLELVGCEDSGITCDG